MKYNGLFINKLLKELSEHEKWLNISESDYATLTDAEMVTLSSFLADRLEDPITQRLALYYASFYWRIKGNLVNALACLRIYLANENSRY